MEHPAFTVPVLWALDYLQTFLFRIYFINPLALHQRLRLRKIPLDHVTGFLPLAIDRMSFQLNVCGSVSDCKKTGDTASFGGCKKSGDPPTYGEKVLNHTAPSYSDDGRLSITYKVAERWGVFVIQCESVKLLYRLFFYRMTAD